MVITKKDRLSYYNYYISISQKRAHVINWARNILVGNARDRAEMQLTRLIAAIEAVQSGKWAPRPGLSPEGVALTILFALNETLAGGEIVEVEGFPREAFQVDLVENKIMVRVGERKAWVYRFSPPPLPSPTSAPSAPTSANEVGARARIKRAR